jgi:thiamine-phosphate pyrophosphorylase
VSLSLRGLYAITDENLMPKDKFLSMALSALNAGVKIIQYRNKTDNDDVRYQQCRGLLLLCRAFGAILIVNDDVHLVSRVGADGVHLGKQDGTILKARRYLGKQSIIGYSCYDSLSRAIDAEQQGADYVAFGRCFSSVTKPDAVQVPLSLFAKAKQQLSVPIVGIGGITEDNITQVHADMWAVIQGVFAGENVRNSVQKMNEMI